MAGEGGSNVETVVFFLSNKANMRLGGQNWGRKRSHYARPGRSVTKGLMVLLKGKASPFRRHFARVPRVGSSAKGTAIKDASDLDLVLMVNPHVVQDGYIDALKDQVRVYLETHLRFKFSVQAIE